MAGSGVEEELRELRARYRVMVEHAPEAIVMFDLDSGKFAEANAQACRLFGMERARLLTVGPVEMSPERQPDGRLSSEAAPAVIERAMSGEIAWFEWVHLNASGAPVLCRIQLARVPSEQKRLVRASILDISERQESERARARFAAILDATPDLVGIANADGTVAYLNPAARALLGIGADEDVTKFSIGEFHPERWTAFLLETAAALAQTGGVWRGESEFRSRDGHVFPTSQVLIAHRDVHGNLEYLSTIARDISDRRAAEQLERKVLHAQKLESLGVLAGGIAHDFNNILVGILANASVAINRAGGDGQMAAVMADIQSAAQRAAELARQMLDYAGKSQSDKTTLALEDVANDVSGLVSASISKSARLVFEFGDDVPRVHGDATQLRQVLMNLIINASDSMGARGGDIRVRTALATVDRARLAHNYLPNEAGVSPCVLLEVADGGTGIDAPLDRIFDPFFTTKFAGRGLGLAAVLGIIKAHSGAIEVDTSPQGTTFRLWFFPGPPSGAISQSPDPARAAPPPFSARGTILVIDDEAMVRRALCLVLDDLGFEAIEAADGAEAETVFREHSGALAAVVLDLTMPGLSGHDVLVRLREIDPAVPVILTSGFSDTVDASKADGFLSKPFTANQVGELLRDVLA